MPAATTITPTISQPLTWKAICQRYPDEWVCLVEFERIDPMRFAFRTARVIGASKQRRMALEQARPWWRRYEEIGQHFTGRSDPSLTLLPRHFVRIDLPWNPVPRFHPCREADVDVVARQIQSTVKP
jgi:hypothetical protein